MKNSEEKQSRQRRKLTGPTAKNTPTQRRVSTPLVVRQDSPTQKKWGGAIKNALPWHKAEASRYRTVVGRQKPKPKGPRAKNSRP